MKHYEIIMIVKTNKDHEINDIIKKYKTFIENEKGIIDKIEDWGNRPLAYPIQKMNKANYILINTICKIKTIKNLNESLKYNPLIIRRLIVKIKQSIKTPSIIIKQITNNEEKNEKNNKTTQKK